MGQIYISRMHPVQIAKIFIIKDHQVLVFIEDGDGIDNKNQRIKIYKLKVSIGFSGTIVMKEIGFKNALDRNILFDSYDENKAKAIFSEIESALNFQ